MMVSDTENNVMSKDDYKEIIDPEIFRGEVRYDEPMSDHTSLKIGGIVDVMVFPEDPVSLKNVLMAAGKEGIPLFVFGSGTNLLVTDERVNGIALSLREFRTMEFTKETDERQAVLYVGAGVPLSALINFARKNGYSGIEALAGIPGDIGGAVFMNAGSFGTEMKDLILSIAVMNRRGEIAVPDIKDLNFTYRRSNLEKGSIVLGATICLLKDSPEAVEERTRNFLDRKKTAQPYGEMSAGCVFRNPEGDGAGRLIDSAGCKGMSVGNVQVSNVHANYFINKGQATCSDFMQLMEEVKVRVKAHSGVELDPEIKVVGRSIQND